MCSKDGASPMRVRHESPVYLILVLDSVVESVAFLPK